MNSATVIRRYIREIQRPDLMMEFKDHREVTRCYKCNDTAKAYTYIPVLGNIFVCSGCRVKWDRWGLGIFKEMINVE